MKYIIYKHSRYYLGGPGYTGPTCNTAEVVPGKIYNTRKAAEKDAKKLSGCNPVGFDVLEYKETK